jgi:hypothetical protein
MSVFQMELNDYPTSTSPRMGDCVSCANIARSSRECHTMHSSVLAMTEILWSNVFDCLGPTAWTGVRFV